MGQLVTYMVLEQEEFKKSHMLDPIHQGTPCETSTYTCIHNKLTTIKEKIYILLYISRLINKPRTIKKTNLSKKVH